MRRPETADAATEGRAPTSTVSPGFEQEIEAEASALVRSSLTAVKCLRGSGGHVQKTNKDKQNLPRSFLRVATDTSSLALGGTSSSQILLVQPDCGKTSDCRQTWARRAVRRAGRNGANFSSTHLTPPHPTPLTTFLFPTATEQNLHLNVIPYPHQFVFTPMNKEPEVNRVEATTEIFFQAAISLGSRKVPPHKQLHTVHTLDCRDFQLRPLPEPH